MNHKISVALPKCPSGETTTLQELCKSHFGKFFVGICNNNGSRRLFFIIGQLAYISGGLIVEMPSGFTWHGPSVPVTVEQFVDVKMEAVSC